MTRFGNGWEVEVRGNLLEVTAPHTTFHLLADTPQGLLVHTLLVELERLREVEDAVLSYRRSRNCLSADCRPLGIGSSSADTPRWEAERQRREDQFFEAVVPLLSKPHNS